MLHVEKPIMHLGDLTFGKTYDFKYVLRNTGDKEIIVDKIVKGCSSCTEAHMTQTTIAPSEIATLYVKFTPGSTGLSSKSITINYTTGGRTESLGLKFLANVGKV